jgi:hypothetical protein
MRIARTAAIAALTLALAACGGSSSKSTSSTHAATAPTPSTAQPGTPTSSVTTGPVRGKLVGENHAPKLKQDWVYTVTVSDANGHPLAGTVLTEFTFGGQVVGRETPPTHRLTNGHLRDTINFPPPSLGEPIAVQTVVHTPQGSITLVWPVTPTR